MFPHLFPAGEETKSCIDCNRSQGGRPRNTPESNEISSDNSNATDFEGADSSTQVMAHDTIRILRNIRAGGGRL